MCRYLGKKVKGLYESMAPMSREKVSSACPQTSRALEVAGDMGSGVRGLPAGAPHDLIVDGAWDPTHAISNKELFARRPLCGRYYPAAQRARRRRLHPTEEERTRTMRPRTRGPTS